MTYDEAVVRWILKRTEREDLLEFVDWDSPPNVTFDSGEGFWYSEYTYEPSWSLASVEVAGQYVNTSLDDVRTGEIIREIVEVVNEQAEERG